jgi:hypothetical protein
MNQYLFNFNIFSLISLYNIVIFLIFLMVIMSKLTNFLMLNFNLLVDFLLN